MHRWRQGKLWRWPLLLHFLCIFLSGWSGRLAHLLQDSRGLAQVASRHTHVNLAASHPSDNVLRQRFRSWSARLDTFSPAGVSTADRTSGMGAFKPTAEALWMKCMATSTGGASQFLTISKVRETDGTRGILPDVIVPRQTRRHQALKICILLVGRSSVETYD